MFARLLSCSPHNFVILSERGVSRAQSKDPSPIEVATIAANISIPKRPPTALPLLGRRCLKRLPLDPVLLPVLSSPQRPRMLGNRSWDDWIAQYSTSHQNPVNRVCHTIGIPLIVLSLIFFVVTIFVHRFWPIALGLFIVGWIFQFVGHAFEGKPPEFFSDWRFLLVGTRWWAAKVRGRV